MSRWPGAIPPSVVVPVGPLPAVEAVFSLALRSGGPPGGVTIGTGRTPRALVYEGPCPEHAVETVLRALLPTLEVSTLRDPAQIKPKGSPRAPGQYRTRTAINPRGE